MKQIFGYIALLLLAWAGVFAQPALRLKTGVVVPGRGSVESRDLSSMRVVKRWSGHRVHRVVQFPASPQDAQIAELRRRGGDILGYIPDFGLAISTDDSFSTDGLGLLWCGKLLPAQKISPLARKAVSSYFVVSFYTDVDAATARAIVASQGISVLENPDLLKNHLLVKAAPRQLSALSEWDEVSYIFPASRELVLGVPVYGCAGAETTQGTVADSVFVVGDGWDGPGQGSATLNYVFENTTTKLSADFVRAEIERAMALWSSGAQVTFQPGTNAAANQTIAILFASGAHGDPFPFDGPGGVLAHTFYPAPPNPEPIAGDMHFDNDESWQDDSVIDLFSVALHELGHALGLAHSDDPATVMYPYYHKVTQLAAGDIASVLALYAPAVAAADPPSQDPPSDPAPPPPNPTTPAQPAPDPAPTPTPSPTPADTTAPSLAITFPFSTTVTTSGSTLSLSGTASDNVGVVAVTWTSSAGSAGTAAGTTLWSIPSVPLATGSNTIVVFARDAAGNVGWRSLVVKRR